MTEKRFKFVDNFSRDEAGMDILDNDTNKRYNKYHMSKICDLLNELNTDVEEYNLDAMSYQTLYEQQLEKNKQLKKEKNYLTNILENQSSIIQELGMKLLEYETEESIILTKESLEIIIHKGGLNG